MLKTIALATLAAALAFPFAASAQGDTGYGTYGPQQGSSTFDRAWNQANESKTFTYETANAVRHHFYAPHHHVYHHNW
jgi:hypothetical protein